MEQIYEIELLDKDKRIIVLSIDGAEHEIARQLKLNASNVRAVLLEVSLKLAGIRFRPVTVFFNSGATLRCVNLDFDSWPTGKKRKIIERVGDFLSGEPEPLPRKIDVHKTLLSNILESLVDHLVHTNSMKLSGLAARAEAAGFTTLASALTSIEYEKGIEPILKSAYIAAELETRQLTVL